MAFDWNRAPVTSRGGELLNRNNYLYEKDKIKLNTAGDIESTYYRCLRHPHCKARMRRYCGITATGTGERIPDIQPEEFSGQHNHERFTEQELINFMAHRQLLQNTKAGNRNAYRDMTQSLMNPAVTSVAYVNSQSYGQSNNSAQLMTKCREKLTINAATQVRARVHPASKP